MIVLEFVEHDTPIEAAADTHTLERLKRLVPVLERIDGERVRDVASVLDDDEAAAGREGPGGIREQDGTCLRDPHLVCRHQEEHGVDRARLDRQWVAGAACRESRLGKWLDGD